MAPTRPLVSTTRRTAALPHIGNHGSGLLDTHAVSAGGFGLNLGAAHGLGSLDESHLVSHRRDGLGSYWQN